MIIFGSSCQARRSEAALIPIGLGKHILLLPSDSINRLDPRLGESFAIVDLDDFPAQAHRKHLDLVTIVGIDLSGSVSADQTTLRQAALGGDAYLPALWDLDRHAGADLGAVAIRQDHLSLTAERVGRDVGHEVDTGRLVGFILGSVLCIDGQVADVDIDESVLTRNMGRCRVGKFRRG